MAARALLLLAVVLAAACGGGSAATTGPTIPGITSAPGSDNPATSSDPLVTLPPSTGGGGGPSLKPSGAKMRIANLYTPATGTPPALDIYGGFSAEAGPLLASVPYGTISDWFDPGVLGNENDAMLSFYVHGKTGMNEEIGTQTETLKGGEQITMFIGAGDADNKNSSGIQFARWTVFFENGTDFPLPSPVADKAIVMALGLALGAVPGTAETFLYMSVDGACLPNVEGGIDGTPQPFGPGSQQNYLAPAGSKDAYIELPGENGIPDCTSKGTLTPVHYDIAAGERAWLAFYSPDGKTLKALQVKVGAP
jgi:hypothetical protein